MTSSQDALEYIMIGASLLMLVGVGFALRKMSSDVSDYFRAGAQGTWYLVGSSAFMAAFSAWTFTGAAGTAHRITGLFWQRAKKNDREQVDSVASFIGAVSGVMPWAGYSKKFDKTNPKK